MATHITTTIEVYSDSDPDHAGAFIARVGGGLYVTKYANGDSDPATDLDAAITAASLKVDDVKTVKGPDADLLRRLKEADATIAELRAKLADTAFPADSMELQPPVKE